jgi:hypothetical protein
MLAADSAKIAPAAEDLEAMRRNFYEARANAWMQLGVTPRALADSAKTVSERERLAAARVDKYLENLAAGKAPFAEVPPPLASALRSNAKVSVNKAGIDRAVELATKAKAVKDSTAKAAQPSSVVPMPGEGPAPVAPGQPGTPAPAPAPAPNKH